MRKVHAIDGMLKTESELLYVEPLHNYTQSR
jgi:hypothetical protein